MSLKIDVRFEGETVRLAQKGMAELFQKDVRTISGHIKAIFDEGELQPESVIRKFRITATDGKNYETQHYNLKETRQTVRKIPESLFGHDSSGWLASCR